MLSSINNINNGRATQEEIYPKAVLEDHVDHCFSNHGRRTGLDQKQCHLLRHWRGRWRAPSFEASLVSGTNCTIVGRHVLNCRCVIHNCVINNKYNKQRLSVAVQRGNARGGGAGGGLLPPQISRWGGSAGLRYHQVMNNYNLIASA